MGLFDYLEEKRNQAVRRRRIKEISKIGTGIALGALGGILFAPQEGKKTREDIANKSKEAANQAINAANDARDTLEFKAYADLRERAAQKKYEFSEDVEVAKAKARAIGEVVRAGAEDIKYDVKNTTDEVKETAKDVKKDLKEGAEDLKKEAKKSDDYVKESVEEIKDKVEKEARK